MGVSAKLILMSKPIYLFSISSHPDAISINSLAITFCKPKIDFSEYDYFIITSKQVSEALKQYEKYKYIKKPALCVSLASAKSYESLGGTVLDIGEGYGDNLIKKIQSFDKETKWLYLRGKIVASDFVQTCTKKGYSIHEAIVYESACSKSILNVEIQEEAILIFTSPSSLKCFLKKHSISKKAKLIVIGKTTAKAVPEGVEYILSEETTIDSCMKIACKI